MRAGAFEGIVADGVHIAGRLLVAGAGALAALAVLPLQAALLAVGATTLSPDPPSVLV